MVYCSINLLGCSRFYSCSQTNNLISELEPGFSGCGVNTILLIDLNDYLSATTNYPGWIKGIYPIREDAVAGIENNTLFVVRHDGKIAGSIILDHHPDEAYNNVRWKIEADYSRIFVISTFVVHPSFLKMGIGRALMDYSFKLAQQSGIKSIRLDVYENNLPAISLYEKCGFEYIDTVDLGFGNYGLDWFKLYEKLV